MEDSKLIINESSPEVKSYIYQQIQDFVSFMSPQTIISVVSNKVSGEDVENPSEDFFEVKISLNDNDTIIEEEAVSRNIFEAIYIAKNKLFNTLIVLQDEAISREDREAQIIGVKNSIMH